MFTSSTSRAARLSASARLRRIATALAVVTGGVLAWQITLIPVAAALAAAIAAVLLDRARSSRQAASTTG